MRWGHFLSTHWLEGDSWWDRWAALLYFCLDIPVPLVFARLKRIMLARSSLVYRLGVAFLECFLLFWQDLPLCKRHIFCLSCKAKNVGPHSSTTTGISFVDNGWGIEGIERDGYVFAANREEQVGTPFCFQLCLAFIARLAVRIFEGCGVVTVKLSIPFGINSLFFIAPQWSIFCHMHDGLIFWFAFGTVICVSVYSNGVYKISWEFDM